MPGKKKLRLAPRKNAAKKRNDSSHTPATTTPTTPTTYSEIVSHFVSGQSKLPEGWAILEGPSSNIIFTKCTTSRSGLGVAAYSLVINQDHSWNVALQCGSIIPSHSYLHVTHPLHLINTDSIQQVISSLDSANICTGNQDEKFYAMSDKRNGKFLNRGIAD